MSSPLPRTGRPHRRGRVARALLIVAAAAFAAGGCDSGTSPSDLPFARVGRVRIDVVTPLTLGGERVGELQQGVVWRSEGPWQLTERIFYQQKLGDETVRRSADDAGVLAQRYAEWIRLVNDPTPVQLFIGDALPPGVVPACASLQSLVTVQMVDAHRADSVSWTRCGDGSLASLSAEDAGADVDVAAGRVIEAAKLLRNATLQLDHRFPGYAYTGSVPFRTVERGEQAKVPLLVPRVIEDAATWSGFWSQYMNGSPPAVDFGREVVLVGAVGTRHEAGDSVEVRRVLPVDFGTQVSLFERRLGDFCTPAPRVHAPFHIVVAPVTGLPRPIFFSVENTDLVPCG